MSEQKTHFKEHKNISPIAIEEQILAFWDKEDIFKKSIDTRAGKPAFVFYEGPPSANGMPGIHHVLSRTIKDIFCRYKTLKGFQVNRKGGWDTHGLPVELSVEKSLGITKKDIGTTISIADYNKKCREEVLKYKDSWDEITKRTGYWVDLDNPYITFENYYIESLWALIKMLYQKNYLYKGLKIQPYSPAAGTGLSSAELNMPGCYRDVKDTSAIAQFKIIKNEKSNFLFQQENEQVYFLAWTTTPWTLPSNTALALGAKIDYIKVRTFNPYTFAPVSVILAKALCEKYFKPENAALQLAEYTPGDKIIPFEFDIEIKGKDLKDIDYEQLMPYEQPETGDAFKVVLGDFVSTEDGTGIVHIAPSFGADDMKVAAENGIGALTLVDKQGKFVASVIDFAGEYVKEAYLTDAEKEIEKAKQGREKYLSVDERITIKLKQENKCFKSEKYEHNYPHCWRTDKPILYYPLDSWFIKVTAVKDRMIELNKTINWKPASTGEGRFGMWLENLVDWNLSRTRFWGTPLPIWRTEDGAEEICIGSIEELTSEYLKARSSGFNENSNYKIKDGKLDIDLHKPFVDDLILVSNSGQAMKREPELIDVWFDSGAMPYAQWHYPIANESKFKENFPADFIAEGVDQTRGWFYTLHALSVMLFDSIAYKNVVSNGLVLDKNGNKMSKRLGNAADPFETVAKYGADATRWYMISNSQPWDNLKFDTDGIEEVNRKLYGTLYNTYAFFALYANIDNFGAHEKVVPLNERPEIDRWIISVLNSLIKEVDTCYGDYEPTKATRAIQTFISDHLSNWYVRLCRRRFWKGEYEADKIAAYQTLYHCLETLTILMAPVAPFYSDYLYKILNKDSDKAISVHLSDFPLVDEKAIDKDLEERMELAQNISSMVLSLRKKEVIKVRQPLQKIMIPVISEGLVEKIEKVKELILSEVNVKEIQYVSDTSGIVKKRIKPNFKVLGKKLGGQMKLVGDVINTFGQTEIQQIEAQGLLNIILDGQSYSLLLSEVEIISDDIEGWLVVSENGITVALDIHLSDTLINEGIARELVNKIQNERKDADFFVTDNIKITVEENEAIANAINEYKDYICGETLAKELLLRKTFKEGKIIEINEHQVHILIEKI
ncbi:MAG: isoleucine--tRNA ligase [Chitinophagales bacterium]|nr:isoleucine--tRNA ligase [Chitinophagales bacterium]